MEPNTDRSSWAIGTLVIAGVVIAGMQLMFPDILESLKGSILNLLP